MRAFSANLADCVATAEYGVPCLLVRTPAEPLRELIARLRTRTSKEWATRSSPCERVKLQFGVMPPGRSEPSPGSRRVVRALTPLQPHATVTAEALTETSKRARPLTASPNGGSGQGCPLLKIPPEPRSVTPSE